jgi:hypothetical protein
MFQLTIFHNDDDACETLEEVTERITRHGLKVSLTTYDPNWDEHAIVVQGTQDQFLSWHTECMQGGPSIEVEEFLEELTPVVNLTAA